MAMGLPTNCYCDTWSRPGGHRRGCMMFSSDVAPSPPTLAEACEVIRGLLNYPEGCSCGPVGPCHFHKAVRDFLKRVVGK